MVALAALGPHPSLPGGQLHSEVLGPGLHAINGLGMHAVADEELILGLAGHGGLRRTCLTKLIDPSHM